MTHFSQKEKEGAARKRAPSSHFRFWLTLERDLVYERPLPTSHLVEADDLVRGVAVGIELGVTNGPVVVGGGNRDAHLLTVGQVAAVVFDRLTDRRDDDVGGVVGVGGVGTEVTGGGVGRVEVLEELRRCGQLLGVDGRNAGVGAVGVAVGVLEVLVGLEAVTTH